MPPDTSTQRAGSDRPAAAGEISILLVDDQPARLMSYESILDGLGYRLVRASSGLAALEQLMKDEFAVILLDVSMPGMDGFETASLIHEHPRFERTPIIFVTGVNLSELDQLKGYRLGAVDYVHVPVVPEILRSKVSVLVELYCKRRELEALNNALAKTNTELAAKNEALATANRALELNRARELEALNRELKRANVELETANRALHAEVAMRARIEEQLKAADRHKDEFLAMLAHELRNPLAPIRNALHIMRAKPTTDPQLGWAQGVIDRQLTSLTRLVDDLLDVSRITRGKINLSREPVALGALIRSAVETVEPLLAEKQHDLTVDVPDPALMLDGDFTRLTQVIANVLSNAAKYTDRGGRIALTAREMGDEVEIRVRDNGIGIAAADLARIFDLFTQASESHERGLGGLGIGLALVRRLVELHGGTVSALSEGPGRGAEIIVRLPRSTAAIPTAAPAASAAPAAATGRSTRSDDERRPGLGPHDRRKPDDGAGPRDDRELHDGRELHDAPAPPDGREPSTNKREQPIKEAASDRSAAEGTDGGAPRPGRRILIVDDNRDALDSLAALMEMSGHEVHAATDGELALEVAERCRPHVVLLDLGLPKLDGYEVARRLREKPWGKEAVIIALTGWGQDEDRRRTRESGFDAHMVKPLDLDALMSLLDSAPADVTHS